MWDFIVEIVLEGLGRLVKKLFGWPISKSGNSEMWLGAAIVAVLFIGLVAFIHYGR